MFSLVELQQQKKEAYFRLQIMIFFWGNGNTAKCKATIYKALIKWMIRNLEKNKTNIG